MDTDVRVKSAVYRHFADTGQRPSVRDVSVLIGLDPSSVMGAYRRLAGQRLLVLDSDETSIRMAPPFSGVPTEHVVEADGIQYFANCAWDALGIPAALHKAGTVRSRCARSDEPLQLNVSVDGPDKTDWLFHCLVPAAKWWEDIVFT